MSEKKYPKITLVTTCYNHADFIAETIESILFQEYPNLEYIVIDDGSTDGSWDIIQTYKDKLTVCEHMDGYRTTPTIALNYAIKKGTGGIMGWLNSDDILLPGSLFRIAQIFTDNENVEWLTGMASTINIKSELVNSTLRLKNKYDFLIGDWKIIQQESTFWRRSLWDKTGGTLCKEWAFDTELWTRFFMETDHYHVDVPLGAFRKGPQSKSVSDEKSFLDPSERHLSKMREKTRIKDKIYTVLYVVCKKVFWPVLAIIPSSWYVRVPILNIFSYTLLKYSFSKAKWCEKRINPFKTKFL
ncbi:MAG: glycosyltransferase [Candidatus Magasanikbacteria bacterium CG_4_9_14_0_2_um_filter_41_10]|nr:MAG: hypothetical protein AUJ37_01315 [Candidatus Magasanikbacteria bacterium CG1_02_41_34]PJC53828.1 MAG: glycosyltransferase [Candidatus Magasanikbacteria bacterium CG_4_9_14_0_2_um_filter_41_10]